MIIIASVNAADLNESDQIEVTQNYNEETQLNIEGDTILETEYAPKNFTQIQNSINDCEEEDTIILDGYYLFEDTVTVNKTVTFQGINHAIVDGNSKVRLFTVTAGNVVFKNITFKNGYSNNGGAINGRCSIVNCTFVNNSASQYGGAIYNCNALNCIFESNSASYGGAMSLGTSINCTFVNNSASKLGGATSAVSAVNCLFINNHNYYQQVNILIGVVVP